LTKVADPYRWLEDDRSAETAVGLKENKVTYGYLNQIPFRDALKPHGETMELKIGAPSKEGNFTYYSKNDGLQKINNVEKTLLARRDFLRS
jgi:prolyl oligopeptidase